MRDEDIEPTGEPTYVPSEEADEPRRSGMPTVAWLFAAAALLFALVAAASMFRLSQERGEAQSAREAQGLAALKAQQVEAQLDEVKAQALRDGEAVKAAVDEKLKLDAKLKELEKQVKELEGKVKGQDQKLKVAEAKTKAAQEAAAKAKAGGKKKPVKRR